MARQVFVIVYTGTAPTKPGEIRVLGLTFKSREAATVYGEAVFAYQAASWFVGEVVDPDPSRQERG